MKKVKEIYGFHVMDEVKEGNTVYYFNKATSNEKKICNSMALSEFAKVIEEEDAEFWELDEQEVDSDA